MSNAYARRLVAMVDDLAVSASALLASVQLTEDDLKPKGKITLRQQQALIEAALDRSRRPELGLLVGQQVSVLDHGSIGYAFVSSRNMRAAFEVFSAYQRIAGPLVNVYCRQNGEHGLVSAVEAYPLGSVHTYAIDDWLAETRFFFDRFDIEDICFNEVRVTHSAPPYAAMYQDMFQCPVTFDAPANEIVFPAEFLDRPFNMADEAVAELCIRQCAEVLKHLAEEDPVVDAVRRVLLNQPGVTPTLGMIAERLHMSTRTLRRRLQEAGTTYKNVLSEVRLGLGAEYLRSSAMSPKEIAYLLGYSGVTSFHRAFKAHFDKTPVEYRSQYE